MLIAAAWIASVAIAYVIGGSGGGGDSGRTSSTAISKEDSALPVAPVKARPSTIVRAADPLEDGKVEKANIPLLISRARLQFDKGMRGIINLREIVRAIGPILELDGSQIPEALAEVENTVREEEQKSIFVALLLNQWAETDGRAAVTYAEAHQKNSLDTNSSSLVLGTWANHDPEAAWRWLETQQKGDVNDRARMRALSPIFSGMAANNLESALSRLGTLDEESLTSALRGIANSASDDASRDRLLERSASLPAGQRDPLRNDLMGRWVMNNPEEAVAWIRSLPADEQKPVRENTGMILLMTKPAMGADFMLEGAEQKRLPHIYTQIADTWARQDSRAAGEWLNKQPQGPELDNARSTYATIVAQSDPALAMDWARSVQDEKGREGSISQVYLQWRKKDPKAADTALNAAGLPPEKLQQIRQTPQSTEPGNLTR